MDPKPQIGISDYAVFGDNPILNSDPNGDVCVPCITVPVGIIVDATMESTENMGQIVSDGELKRRQEEAKRQEATKRTAPKKQQSLPTRLKDQVQPAPILD